MNTTRGSERESGSGRRGVGSRVVFKLKRFVRYIGLHKRVITMPDGVKYRELSGISIRRAISEHGPGYKRFDVRFPWVDSEGRRGLRIRYTASRVYGDVGHDPRTTLYAQVQDLITPGFRVLEVGCGTGSGSAMLAQFVGPSGGVVAVDRDGQAIRFARMRHQSDHCGFELDWIEAVNGEISGAFEAVVGVDLMREAPDSYHRHEATIEIARVVRPGGVLVLIVSNPEELDALERGFGTGIDGNKGFGFKIERRLEQCPRSGWSGVALRRPGESSPPGHQDHNPPGPFQS